MKIITPIERYLDIATDKYHRYKSWDRCFIAFKSKEQTETHTLELAFFLASWGMYRGSCDILQKNHLIHEGAVDILFSEESRKLKCNENNEANINNVESILRLKDKLVNHYKSNSISPTDTLISKILLGTLGCAPAYDRYFISGLKEMKIKNKAFNYESLIELINFFDKSEIVYLQKFISEKLEIHYPIMKIIDMYFWQIGYEKENEVTKHPQL